MTTVQGRPGFGQAVSHSLTLTRRNLLGLLRSPELMMFNVIQPIMFVLLFVYVFGGSIEIPGGNYRDFLLPGIIIQTVAFATFNTGIGLATDLSTGILDRFRSLPIARSAVLSGRILGDTVRLAINILIIVLVGLVVGFRFSTGFLPALAALGLSLAFGVSFSMIAAWIGLALRNPEAVQSGGFIWMFPLTFASSAFVRVETLPGWLRTFAEYNPITAVIDALRALLLGGPITTPLLRSLAWIAGIGVVFFLLAVRQYRRISI